ncbi:IucA/IucC family C-terminal-domain containing protein [Halalkalibacterium ligniniphilum]|uniref:IucA/IucC family C-terminal-domain containing protein n=1 Tax=Halalkalibacterium ligniniphilum TaxID=1134413 RepID=UPI000379D76D|nr:IucA/IucC family C-terminal-domain containing protein [Halalkalibacterium ligniniphilum]
MNQLTKNEKERLLQFRTTFSADSKITAQAIRSIDLLDVQFLTSYLYTVKDTLQAADLLSAASMFSKRYSYLVAVPAFYSFSRFQKQLNVSLKNTELLPDDSSEIWLPQLYLTDQHVRNVEQRSADRSRFFQMIFADHFHLIWERLATLTSISKQTLWENTAVYLFWIYETMLNEVKTEAEKAIIQEDFHALLDQSQAYLFGPYRSNPLSRFYGPKITIDGQDIRFRKTCCFSYQCFDKSIMCHTCPKLKP